MGDAVLQLTNITKRYAQAGEALEVLRGCDLSIAPGELVALVGPSGSGKSTLLQIIGLLDRPNSGSITLMGHEMSTADDALRTRARREGMGFVYQFHHLLPEFSAVENIMLPLMLLGDSSAKARKQAMTLLESLGLGPRAEHRPARLSGGEQQRVAILRAIASRPALLLADEPTGNLDPATAETVFHLLVGLAKEHGLSALIATHNPELARKMDRVVTLRDGRLVRA